jgi:tripartite-type tricarboxylate transporter receptor subunit TctC
LKLTRRTFLHLAAGAAALPSVSRFARAQAYPTRPVRLLVGWPPGGAADVVGRLRGQLLSERLGQQFVIENRPGAGGNLAVEAALKAAPDGYTLLMIGSNNARNVTLYDNLSFDFVRDIAPVASIVRGVGVLVVHPSVSAKSVPDLIAYAKANPGKINMASGGVGSPQHVYGELFKMMAGVDMLHVPYRGGAPALTDLLAGQVQVMFDTLITSIEHIRAGKLRPLAVTAATRVEVLPDIPTVGEFVSGYEAVGWQGVGAPRTTPVEIIDKLNKEINAGPRRESPISVTRACKLACRLRQIHRRIYREVGQGNQVLRCQSLLLLICNFRAAFACLASIQMTGNPSLLSSVHSQVDVAPVSSPTRATCGACDLINAAMVSGSDATTPSRSIFPVRSTMQIAVSFSDTSNPT